MTRWIQQMIRYVVAKPAIFFALYATWLSAEYWALGWSSYLSIHDNADHYMPVLLWWANPGQEMSRVLPVLSGVDLLSAATWLNAFAWLFRIFPPWLANGIVAWLQRFCCSYFTYRVLKDDFRVSDPASYAAAIVYPLMPFEYGELRYMHGLDEPGLPLLLWGFCRVAEMRLWVVGAGLLSLVTSAAAGPFIGVPFIVPVALVVAWLLKVNSGNVWRVTGRLLLGLLMVLVITYGPRWEVLRALYATSNFGHREQWLASGETMPWLFSALEERARAALDLWLFAILGLYAIGSKTTETRLRWALGFLLISGFLLGPFAGGVVREISTYLTFLKGFTASRFSKVTPFALVVGLGLAIHGLRSEKSVRIGEYSIDFLAAIFISACALFLGWQIKTDRLYAIQHEGRSWRGVFRNPALQRLSKQQARGYRWATVGAFHDLHPMYLLGYGVEIADGYVDMYPQWYHHYWQGLIGPLLRRDERKRSFFGWGHRVYLFLPDPNFWSGCGPLVFGDWYRLPLFSLLNVKYVVSAFPLEDPHMRCVYNPDEDIARKQWNALSLGEKLAKYWQGELPPGRPLYVYENTAAFPRVFSVSRMKTFDSDSELYSALEHAGLEDLREYVYVQANSVQEQDMESVSGDVQVLEFEQPAPHRYRIVAAVQGSGWLVVSQLYYPWWTCRVDGVSRPVVRVDGCLVGVRVTEGDSLIELERLSPQPD